MKKVLMRIDSNNGNDLQVNDLIEIIEQVNKKMPGADQIRIKTDTICKQIHHENNYRLPSLQ